MRRVEPRDSPILTLFDQPAGSTHLLPEVCQVPRHRAASGKVPATQESKSPVREPDLETDEIPLLNEVAEPVPPSQGWCGDEIR